MQRRYWFRTCYIGQCTAMLEIDLSACFDSSDTPGPSSTGPSHVLQKFAQPYAPNQKLRRSLRLISHRRSEVCIDRHEPSLAARLTLGSERKTGLCRQTALSQTRSSALQLPSPLLSTSLLYTRSTPFSTF